MLWLQILFLIIGFGFLIKGADWLVDGASSLAKRFGIRDIVIGLTIVAFGTSTPELVVNLFSAVQGTTDLAVGNIIGSNIANILLILGIAGLIYPLKVIKGTTWKEIPLSLAAALAVFFLLNDGLIDGSTQSVLARADGLVLLLFFAIFLYYTYGISSTGGETDSQENTPQLSLPLVGGMITGGLVGLVFGGKLIVDNAVAIASGLGVSQGLIGLTIVAVGTSLPELATSAVAAWRGKADIAVGNVVGSNIFNIFFILAVTGVIAPLPLAPHMNVDIGVAIAASLALFLAMFVGKRHLLERWQAGMFIASYLLYIGYLIWRG